VRADRVAIFDRRLQDPISTMNAIRGNREQARSRADAEISPRMNVSPTYFVLREVYYLAVYAQVLPGRSTARSWQGCTPLRHHLTKQRGTNGDYFCALQAVVERPRSSYSRPPKGASKPWSTIKLAILARSLRFRQSNLTIGLLGSVSSV